MANALMIEQPAALPVSRPPYPAARRGARFALRQFLGLLRVMLTEYRATWWVHVLFGCLMPLGMLFLIRFVGLEITPQRAIFLIGGNMTTAIVLGPLNMLATRIGWGKETRAFDYWAALPLSKVALVLAMTSVSMLFTLPGIVGVWLLGSLIMGLPLTGGLLLLPLLPLGAFSMAGLGAFVGAYATGGQSANQYANFLMAFVTFLSPMMIPVESMPRLLQWTAKVMPTTYVADAFRLAMAGELGPALIYNVGILLLFTAAFLVLVSRKLDWRSA